MDQVTKPWGTAYGEDVPGLPFGGKTGTAETDGGNGPNTTWFVAYAPSAHPKIALRRVHGTLRRLRRQHRGPGRAPHHRGILSQEAAGIRRDGAKGSGMIAHEIRPSAAARAFGEGAFEALARARELEAQGTTSFTSRSASPISTRPNTSSAPASRDRAQRDRTTRRRPASRAARRDRRLRRALPRHAAFRRDEVVVSPGLKPLIWNVMCALLDPGDEVVFADPAYPSYASCANYLQANAVARSAARVGRFPARSRRARRERSAIARSSSSSTRRRIRRAAS
jgi:hypothetical protein